MKKSRYSDEQIIRILRGPDKAPIAEVAKRHGVSEQSIYCWRKRFGEISSDEVKHLKALEHENAKLKKLVVDLSLDKAMLQDVLSKKI
jgi:putative transposase